MRERENSHFMSTMIRIDHVSKQYRLGQFGETSLRDVLQRANARLHRREDPTKRIGADRISNEPFMALDDISFDVKQGERVGIIGRNGAGKSTLLKLISRITAPTSGIIGLNGRVASMREVGTGFHTELTGRENIYMNGAILGMKKREIDRKLDSIIDFSECEQFIDTPVKRYSSGMYVKLAFSVAAHLDAEIMIMDEVLAVGDMAFQKKCLDKMQTVSQTEGRTILYVSHQMDTIRRLCDRCVVLDHGKLTYQGEVQDAISRYMNINTAQFEKEVDLAGLPSQKGCTQRIRLIHASVLNAEGVYSSTDRLHLKVTVESDDTYEDVRFMFILFYADGSRLGKTESQNFTVYKGLNETEIRIPCAGMADGMYFYEMSVYRKNDDGLCEKCDSVPNVFPVTIYNTEAFGLNTEKWKSAAWGHFMLRPVEISGTEPVTERHSL